MTGVVLIAYDGSEDAAAAICHAGALLPSCPAIVVNVWRPLASQAAAGLVALPTAVVHEAAEKLDRAAAGESEMLARAGAALARQAGFNAEPVARRGERSPALTLLHVAKEHGARVIVIGSRGLSGPRAALLGSVSGAVAHHSTSPVLIAHGGTSLAAAQAPAACCYDGSADGRDALEAMDAVLAPRRAIVISVWESARGAERARATAKEGAEIATGAGFDAEPVPARANGRILDRERATVWRTIVDLADERRAAVIAVGRRGLSGTRSALLGSISAGVLRHAGRPVLLVPATSSAGVSRRAPLPGLR